jgi:hypothetical protein
MADLHEDEGLGALATRLVADARAYLDAEIDYWRMVVLGRLREAQGGLALGGAALVLGLAAAIAVLVGLEFALADLVGHLLAALILLVVGGGVTALLGWLAYQRLRRLGAPLERDSE